MIKQDYLSNKCISLVNVNNLDEERLLTRTQVIPGARAFVRLSVSLPFVKTTSRDVASRVRHAIKSLTFTKQPRNEAASTLRNEFAPDVHRPLVLGQVQRPATWNLLEVSSGAAKAPDQTALTGHSIPSPTLLPVHRGARDRSFKQTRCRGVWPSQSAA